MKSSTVFKKIIALFILVVISFSIYWYTSNNLFATNYKFKMQEKGMSVLEFQKRISNIQKPVLVYFNASWCVPCVKLKPEMNELENEIKNYCDILQINTDDNPAIADFYEINSLPMFVLYKNGKKVWENIGSVSKSQLQTKIEAYK